MRLSKARRQFVTAMMKDTIFEATDAVLEQHGVGGITMERVATTAGLAKGSLYNYFQDKDDLLQFFYARLVEPFFGAIEQIVNADLPAPEKLKRILGTALEHVVKHKSLVRLLAGSNQESQIRKSNRPRLLRMLTAVFEQGIAEGTFPPYNPAHLARMLNGCLSGLFELQAEGASNEEVRAYVGLLVDAARHRPSLDADRTGARQAS